MAAPYKTETSGVSPFHRHRYESASARHWNAFYARNGARFYRDRHWLRTGATDGFPFLSTAHTVLECGCGAANAAFPLLAALPRARVAAFDFAPAAVALVCGSPAFDAERMCVFCWDFARQGIDEVAPPPEAAWVAAGGVDCALMLFVLSAVPPGLQAGAVRRVAGLLRAGGRVCFRDYCVEDLAKERFKAGRRIDEGYYVRQDCTLSYFFDEDGLEKVMAAAGLVCVELRRVRRTVVNRKEGKEMHRVWLQAVYEKPGGAWASGAEGRRGAEAALDPSPVDPSPPINLLT